MTGKILDSFQSLAFYHLVMEKPINEYELESDIRFLYTPPVCIVAQNEKRFVAGPFWMFSTELSSISFDLFFRCDRVESNRF